MNPLELPDHLKYSPWERFKGGLAVWSLLLLAPLTVACFLSFWKGIIQIIVSLFK